MTRRYTHQAELLGYDLVDLDRGDLIVLAEWADFVAPLCGDFQTAVDFILTGAWLPRAPYIERGLEPNVAEGNGLYHPTPEYTTGALSIHSLELGIIPQQLADAYQEAAKSWGARKWGRPFERKKEVLGCVVLEVKEIEGVLMGTEDFTARVYQRWGERCRDFGSDVAGYTPETARKAVQWLDDRLKSRHSKSPFRSEPHLYLNVPGKTL